MKKITIPRRFKYLKQYMDEYIDAWPNKINPFDSWLQSIFDKGANIGEIRAVALHTTKCRYCRRLFEDNGLDKTRDHVVPLSRGGLNTKENRVPCCFPCNQWKNDRPLSDWLKEIKRLLKKGEARNIDYTVTLMGHMASAIETVMGEVKANAKKVSKYKVKK